MKGAERFKTPVTLAGRHVTLLPLSASHHDELAAAVADGDVWKLWYASAPKPTEMEAEIERRLQLQEQGTMLPFAVRRNDQGALCGMTTFMNIEADRRRVEIGSTWYGASAQRTAVNTECKRLLLAHAFETLQCIAVELRTNRFNFVSRAAIERLGAKQDGILRNRMKYADGSYLDTVVFSITDQEWLAVKRHLDHKLTS